MDIQLIIFLLIAIIAAVVVGNVISNIIIKKNSLNKNDITEEINKIGQSFRDEFGPVKNELTTNKTIIEQKAQNIQAAHDKLVNSLTGSSRFGATGELLLESLLKSSGLVEGIQYIQNQSYIKDGTTLRVEFAIKHPTGLVLPIDSHWTKTLYENLLELRKESPSDQRDEKIREKYKEIIKDYGNKAKDVNEKYISSPISTDFACVYVPSESLYLELNTHITEKKELWISEIQKKYKVTFMGPSTFNAYVGAILLGFKAISADKRSQNFLKHLDKFKKLLETNQKLAETSQNKAESAAKSATEVYRSAEKLNIEMEKVDEELHDMEKNNEN
jgi:DNA recombination protein RmuC